MSNENYIVQTVRDNSVIYSHPHFVGAVNPFEIAVFTPSILSTDNKIPFMWYLRKFDKEKGFEMNFGKNMTLEQTESETLPHRISFRGPEYGYGKSSIEHLKSIDHDLSTNSDITRLLAEIPGKSTNLERFIQQVLENSRFLYLTPTKRKESIVDTIMNSIPGKEALCRVFETYGWQNCERSIRN